MLRCAHRGRYTSSLLLFFFFFFDMSARATCREEEEDRERGVKWSGSSTIKKKKREGSCLGEIELLIFTLANHAQQSDKRTALTCEP